MKAFYSALFLLTAFAVPALGARSVSQEGYDLIKTFEGCELIAYQDVAGVWTIGYGNTYYPNGTVVKQGDRITQAQADEMFEYIVDTDFAPEVDSLVGTAVIIRQQQFDALTSFTYNVGVSAFSSSTLLRKLRVFPDDPTIRDEFLRWVYAGGDVVPGLVTRREKESAFYFSKVTDC